MIRRSTGSSKRFEHREPLQSPGGKRFLSILCLLSAALAGGCGRPKPPPKPAPIAKIDVHLHVDPRSAPEALAILAEQHIAVGLNASGGEPTRGFANARRLAEESEGRLLPYCNLPLSLMVDPAFPDYIRAALSRCKEQGGVGLKIAKHLGLGLIDDTGALVAVDDPRLDIVFETAGEFRLPVLIHSGDPRAFFEPNGPQNERYEELRVHPDWSFHGIAPNGQPWPSWQTLLAQFEARVARHPQTTFLGAHLGNAAEEPERVARMLKRYPNLFVDTAARVPEFGRHAAAQMRRFFIEFQDRVLFGSDLGVGPSGLMLGSSGERPGTRDESRVFFSRHWEYFETQHANMANPTPIQGRWPIQAVGLPRAVLEKLYRTNAERVFNVRVPRVPATAKP